MRSTKYRRTALSFECLESRVAPAVWPVNLPANVPADLLQTYGGYSEASGSSIFI